VNSETLPGVVFQAVPGYEDHLERELGCWQERFGPELYYCSEAPADEKPVFWTRNVWQTPFKLSCESINDAASSLRDIQRNWSPSLFTCYRRGALIRSKLPALSAKPRPFPWLLPEQPIGSWTLLDEHHMLASASAASPFPSGVIRFEEDHQGPPSRAYLKLWEALVRMRRWPRPGDRCIDLGASPGGWSWALAGLGAEVLAIDRAPLDERIGTLPGVQYFRHDAFTLKAAELAAYGGGNIDWVFCDAACYPSRLYSWVQKMLDAGLECNFVCTLKMQGAVDNVDFETPRLFAAIPGGRVLHLYHNKHELTWLFSTT
jgi:23S rRNA (cytidine2498-2'-O)-methyltransferase